jgi:peptidoglycan/xylan/chitin deacetylase (PgdA/CDA1 family)
MAGRGAERMRLDWRRQTRKAIAGLLFHSRLITLLSHSGSGRRFIIAYHRVLPEGSEDLSFVQPGMYVTGATFGMHIRHLLAHYDVVPLEDLISRQEGHACAITFDDGWRDNYVTAFPILRAYGVPATIFLATNRVGAERWPWPDRICFYIHRASPARFTEAFESAWQRETGESARMVVRSSDAFATAEVVLRWLKHLEHSVLQRFVTRIDDSFKDLNAALHSQRPWLKWEEALEMGSHGISFGSHTENHVILTNVPPAEARAEIVNSGTVLAARLGKPTTAFCYPNGSYSPEVVRMVADAGYRCAVTTTSGPLESSAGPFELRRIMLHNDISNTPALFACALAGLGGFPHVWQAGGRRSG